MDEFVFPYSAYDLTLEVNRYPNVFGYLNALNWFPNEGKMSKFVRIEYRDGELHVLEAKERGGNSDTGGNDAVKGVVVEIPHFPYRDFSMTADFDGLIQVLNGTLSVASLDTELTNKLKKIRLNHSITREFLRIGALNGTIKDGKGRILYDLYEVFGITQTSVDFLLGTAGTDIIAKCEEVSDAIHTELKGEVMTGIEAIVDTKFFNKFIQHPNVEKYWLQSLNSAVYSQSNLQRQNIGGNWGRVFDFGQGGIVLREYKGALPVKNSNGAIVSQQNVADNSGTAIPVGTMNMLKTFDGPVFHMNLVNEMPDEVSEPIFVSPKILDHGEGIELKSQSNPLAINKRPELAIALTTSN